MRDQSEIVPGSMARGSTGSGSAGQETGAAPTQPGTVRLLLVRARALPLDLWLGVAVVAIALGLRLWPLGAPSTEYDEGVYWQSLRAMALGHPLFTSIFSSQPPLFLLSIYPFYLLFGQSLVAARGAIVLFSLASLLGMYVAARTVGGRWVGLIALALLALDPLYLKASHTLEAEIPALAFAVASVALAALAAEHAGERRRWLVGASGLALALGCCIKLFDVAALAPVALYLLAPAGATLTDEQDRLRWPGAARVADGVRTALPDILACAVGILVGFALVMLPFVGRWAELYDQVVRFHMAAARTESIGLIANLLLLANVGGELPLELLAAAAVVAALAARRWRIVPPAAWALAAVVLLARQQPLFLHHVALLIPALALSAAVGLPSLAAVLPAVVGVGRAAFGGHRAQVGLALALLGAVLAWGVGVAVVQGTRGIPPAPCQDATVARALDATTQPGDLVVADDQYIVGLADRNVPPQLVDTSLVRIQTGYLTLAQLQAAVRQSDVRAILFCSGRFDLVPGFRAWVAANYALVGSFGAQGQGALYLKLPHPIVPA